MKEINDDIWNYHNKGCSIVIPTNGFVKKDGTNVMGRGLAKQASERFLDLPKRLGLRLSDVGNHVFWFPEYRVYTFPVKHNWYESADLELIKQSTQELITISEFSSFSIALPRVGCGNGNRDWETEVKPILEDEFEGMYRFLIVNKL